MGIITRSPLRAGLFLFALSFVLRSALLPYVPLDPEWTLRMENGSVADQMVRTGEYANPYVLPTGPTGHTIPFYTGVMALIYRIFGVTMAAEYARCWLTIVSFSTMYALLPWFAVRLGLGLMPGFLGGLVGLLDSLHMVSGISGELGEEFAAVALGLLMVASLARWSSGGGSVARSFLLGVGWGAAFHASPPLLLVTVGFTAFELWWSRSGRKWALSAAMVAGIVLACAPWAWRNYVALGDFVFIRSNFGLELRMGNHDGAAADMDVMDRRRTHGLHPGLHPEEAEKVAQWGELTYMRHARGQALQWIRQHPWTFLQLTASRVVHFWFGSLHLLWVVTATSLVTILAILGAVRVLPTLTIPQRATLLIPLATFPLIYYVVAYMPRYRIPIDWILLVFMGVEVSHWITRRQSPGLVHSSNG